MNLATKPLSYYSMSLVQLEEALKKQRFLKEKMSSKLPDKGRKLDESISKIQKILTEKQHLLQSDLSLPASAVEPNPTREPGTPSLVHLASLHEVSAAKLSNELRDPVVDEVADDLASLYIEPKNSPLLQEINECFESIPSLTDEEHERIRLACNLPSVRLHDLYWFIFRIYCFHNSLVSLTIVDCQLPTRSLTRCGALSTWPIYSKGSAKHQRPASSENLTSAPTVTVGEALCDLWRFVGTVSINHHRQPVLLCSDLVGPDDMLSKLRRLFCSARHHRQSRSSKPRDILFANVRDIRTPWNHSTERSEASDFLRPGEEVKTEEGVNFLENAFNVELYSCLDLRKKLFLPVLDAERKLELKLRDFQSSLDFLSRINTKSSAWLEAPLNLLMLRKVALPPNEVQTHPPYVSDEHLHHSSDSITSKNNPLLASDLLKVDDTVLRRLAATGFSPSSLVYLAGTFRWRGFAGLLSSNRTNTLQPSSTDDLSSIALVSSNLDLLLYLYKHFYRVYKGLLLNASCFVEEDIDWKPAHFSSIVNQNVVTNLPSSRGSATSVCVWTGSAIASQTRQLKSLSLRESIEMMSKMRRDYLTMRDKLNLPELPSMPPKSIFLKKYREDSLDSDDDRDTLTSSDHGSSDADTAVED